MSQIAYDPEVLLYFPRSSESRYRLPMSLLALASVLEGKASYDLVDGRFFADPERQLADLIRQRQPRILALTVMPGPQLHEAIPLTRYMKQRFPELCIIWGGYFPSNHPDVVLNSGYVDVVVRGTAEGVFPDLVSAVINNGSFGDLAGVSWLRGGTIQHNPLPAVLPDLDLSPPWPYHRLRAMPAYFGRTFLGRRTTTMHTSYGCPFKCSFCAVVPVFDGGWRGKSAAAVAEELAGLIRDYNIDAVEFCDNNFFTSVRRVQDFCRQVLARNLRVQWWGEGRPDTLDRYSDDTLALMRRAGCRMIFLGAESGSAVRLREMNKGGTQQPETILRIAERFRRYDIIPEFSFVLGAPAEDVDSAIEEEIAFIRRLKRLNPVCEIILYLYSPVPLYDSTLFKNVAGNGFAFPANLEGWLLPPWRDLDLRKDPRTPWLKPHHLSRIRNFETVLNARYPTASDIKLGKWRRSALRSAGSWRYAAGMYRAPYEVKLLQRAFRYRQPELDGFERTPNQPT